MKYFVSLGDEVVEVELRQDEVLVDGEPYEADLVSVPGTRTRSLLLNGASHPLAAARRGRGHWELTMGGQALDVEVLDRRGKAIRDIQRQQAALMGPAPVRAPMPGMVVKVEVGVGDEVAVGQGVAVVEAMKMENELSAPADGRVSAVRVEPGESVAKDQVLVEFEAPDGDAEGQGGDEA